MSFLHYEFFYLSSKIVSCATSKNLNTKSSNNTKRNQKKKYDGSFNCAVMKSKKDGFLFYLQAGQEENSDTKCLVGVEPTRSHPF